MLTPEEKMKQIMEENKGLKSYIHSINSECLELNAVLFDEANKLVNAARAKQHAAEKKAREKAQENELLRTQVDELKALVESLPNPTSSSLTHGNDNAQDSLKIVSKKPPLSRFRTLGSKKSPTQSSTPQAYRSCEDLNLPIEPTPGELLRNVSRTTLLHALLDEKEGLDQVDQVLFQNFLDWIKVGCPLQLPPTFPFDTVEQGTESETTPIQATKKRLVIVRWSDPTKNQSNPDLSAIQSYRTTTFRPKVSQKNTFSTASSLGTSSCSVFIQRLYDEDVRPCLSFKATRLQYSIYNALPELALEMVPLSSRTDAPNVMEICPLLPPHEVSYSLTVKNPDVNATESDQFVTASISAAARNRIAAVVNLFQYLSMINRGLINTTSVELTGAHGSSNLSSPKSNIHHDTVLNKQFAKIQRLRLSIAFAKLGFGLPDFE